jgi:hypothetical protein
MRYRLFLYSSVEMTGDPLAAEAIDWLQDFDIEEVRRQIESILKDRCRVNIWEIPARKSQRRILAIATSYLRIHEVLPWLYAITMENGLVLYDAEIKKSYLKELVDYEFISFKRREQEMKNIILKEVRALWKIKKIFTAESAQDKSSAFVVTLKKEAKVSFAERTKQFYECLKGHLLADENLSYENNCFVIAKGAYSIIYCLEGYKKHANQRGYVRDGRICTSLLHRMGTEEAFKWLKGCSETEIKEINQYMHFQEMKEDYPDPSDRFAASIRTAKKKKKNVKRL